MAYFKINNVDYSQYTNKLKITKDNVYQTVTTADKKTTAKFISSNYTVEAGIIPIEDSVMMNLQRAIKGGGVSITFLDTETNQLKTITAIIKKHSVEYYTIQETKTMFKAFSLTFEEAKLIGGSN